MIMIPVDGLMEVDIDRTHSKEICLDTQWDDFRKDPMTPEPAQTYLPRLAQILHRLQTLEKEQIQLERELRDLKLTESKTLLTES